MKFTPFNRLLRMLELDRQDIIYVYVYAVLAGIITLSLPLGIQAIIGLIAGGSVSSALFIMPYFGLQDILDNNGVIFYLQSEFDNKRLTLHRKLRHIF